MGAVALHQVLLDTCTIKPITTQACAIAQQASRVEAVREESALSLANMGASASRGTHAGARSGVDHFLELL